MVIQRDGALAITSPTPSLPDPHPRIIHTVMLIMAYKAMLLLLMLSTASPGEQILGNRENKRIL